jgi:two-component system chemotaxis response regulator CheB
MYSTPRKVLAIDRPLYGAALKNTIFREGESFQLCALATSFPAAQRALWESQPDLILLDPEMLGPESERFVNLVRDSETPLPIIGFGEETMRARAEFLHLDTFLPKPPNVLKLNAWQGEGSALLDHLYQRFQIPRMIKVMIVDDAALMLSVISKIVKTQPDMDVIAKEKNGQEALDDLKTHQPDVILLDIEMPVMDGLTFLKHARIKSQAKVIILSSVSLTGSAKAAEARRLGADAIMTKPSGAVSMNLEEASGSQIIRTIHQVLRQ